MPYIRKQAALAGKQGKTVFRLNSLDEMDAFAALYSA